MRFLTLLVLMLSVVAPSLLTIGQQQPLNEVINELFPQVAVKGASIKVVWQGAQPYDLFQRPNIPEPWLPKTKDEKMDTTIWIDIYPETNKFRLYGAARPKISADANWLVYHDEKGQLKLLDISGSSPKEVPLAIRRGSQSSNSGIFPAISDSGRFIAFLAQDGSVWRVYVHDRQADSQQDNSWSLPDLSLDKPVYLRHIALEEQDNDGVIACVTWVDREGTNWELWFGVWVGRWQGQNQQRYWDWVDQDIKTIQKSTVPIQGGFVAIVQNQDGFVAQVAFSIANFVAVFDNAGNQLLQIQTNGVNGAPVLSRDGQLLAFHSTMTAYRVNSGAWIPLINKRNAVDDVFVFDLAKRQIVWSTLAFRPNEIPIYAACINPNLTDLNAIAFQQVAPILLTSQVYVSRVRIVRNGSFVR